MVLGFGRPFIYLLDFQNEQKWILFLVRNGIPAANNQPIFFSRTLNFLKKTSAQYEKISHF